VPDAAAARARDATKGLQRLVHAAPSVELAVVQFQVATRFRNPEDRDRSERVEVGDDECRFEILGGIMHLLRDRPRAEHLAQRVDRAVMIHDPAVRIALRNFLKLPTTYLIRLNASAPRGAAGAHRTNSRRTAA
jgi:hypothetical protein